MARTLTLRPMKDDNDKLSGMVLLCNDVGYPYATLHVDDLWTIDDENAIHHKLRDGETVLISIKEVA